MDQFYTKPSAARWCTERFAEAAETAGLDLGRHWFVEPSAGAGAFYDLMPRGRRIGMDSDPPPGGPRLMRADYLKWSPPPGDYVVLGNPPFGLRGHLALRFINHSAAFAAASGFVLPQMFASDGKGAAGKRVDKRYRRTFSAPMPPRSFTAPDGGERDINAIFQVWIRTGEREREGEGERKTCDPYITVYSLSDGGTPSSTRNKKMLRRCDVYLPSTCFSGMRAYRDFEELPHRRGYGAVALRERERVIALLMSADWERIAFRSTNGALNLRAGMIRQVVIDGGLYHQKRGLFPPK